MPAAAKSSRSASPKSLRTFGLAGVRPIIRAICNIKPAGSLILQSARLALLIAYAYIIPHAGRFSNRYSLFAANLMLIFQ